jgi:hypothetical protein
VQPPPPPALQSAKPAAHWYEHLPAVHARPVVATWGSCAQLLPHPPQLLTSVPVRLTHVAPQSVVPVGHWHEPAWHVSPPEQAVHEVPQCIESLIVVAHVPPQRLWPVGQAHTPA